MSTTFFSTAARWALVVPLAFGASAVAQAQNEEPQDPVIQIGKADEGTSVNNLPRGDAQSGEQTAPKYWIGLAGAAIPAEHVLRAHIDLPEGQGLLVASVVPDSPAAKAGVKQHDILVSANGADLHEMQNLVEMVIAEGEKKGEIKLDVLRKGKHETLAITPEERPAALPRPQLGGGELGDFGGVGPEGIPQELLEQFQGRIPFEFRNFGPGVIVGGGGAGLNEMPDGVSISVSKTEGQPTKVTVKRGEETWEVVGNDPESLKQLPEDLRPAVEQMLNGTSPMDLHLRGQLRGNESMPELGDGRLRERLERMEKRMQDLMERLDEQNGNTPEADTSK